MTSDSSATTSGAVRLWRRAKRGVADEVRAGLEPDLVTLAARFSALEQVMAEVLQALTGEVGSLKSDLAVVREALTAQLDTENESSDLFGRLLVRLTARVEELESLVPPGHDALDVTVGT